MILLYVRTAVATKHVKEEKHQSGSLVYAHVLHEYIYTYQVYFYVHFLFFSIVCIVIIFFVYMIFPIKCVNLS